MNDTDIIFNPRKMRKFFKSIEPKNGEGNVTVTIKIGDEESRRKEKILSRLDLILPGYIIMPAVEAYQYDHYHIQVRFFSEMKQAYKFMIRSKVNAYLVSRLSVCISLLSLVISLFSLT